MIAIVLVVEFASALAVTGLALAHERRIRFRALEATIRGHADSLVGAVQDSDDVSTKVMLDGTQKTLPKADLYEVRDEHGALLGRSERWSDEVPPELAPDRYAEFQLNRQTYMVLHHDGVRVVDPGTTGGGQTHLLHVTYASSEAHIRHEIAEAVSFYALTSLALLLATGLILWWLLTRELAPVHELATQATRVSVTSWEFHPSDRVMATDELAPLAKALGAALTGLEASFTQQERFVSDAAHELKTATAVVKSSLQLLSMRERTAEEYRAGLLRSERDCERMEEIVARMLALARVGASAQPLPALRTCSVVKVLREVAEQLQPIAEVREIALRLEIEDRLSTAPLDADELRLICSNLLLNAIQYSPNETTITATVTHSGLRIADQGHGIAPEALPHVFERFFRGDASRSRETGGAGLGLAICKAIVDRVQGEIAIASSSAGTTLTVRFPG
ncbi:Signal transduction histidine kinase [Granulicella rosea]|uniref:histidine kinase n=2 Tax=Granulicella rosea TaxID=474952 RepID=A0A239L941_9BACT|nr:Signal transduction histidine kinase [Granulicella rosea]